MPAAILFRGHSYREPVPGKHGVDWRKCIGSQCQHILVPLLRRYRTVHHYLVTYDNPLLGEVLRDYMPLDHVMAAAGGSQRDAMLQGLDLLNRYINRYEPEKYDMVVICRFDLEILSDPMSLPDFDPDLINFLWREWNRSAWEDHRRVPDALFYMPGHLVRGFTEGVRESTSPNCLHTIYYPVVRHGGEENVNIVIPDGFIDSNTDIEPNPIYRMIRVNP